MSANKILDYYLKNNLDVLNLLNNDFFCKTLSEENRIIHHRNSLMELKCKFIDQSNIIYKDLLDIHNSINSYGDDYECIILECNSEKIEQSNLNKKKEIFNTKLGIWKKFRKNIEYYIFSDITFYADLIELDYKFSIFEIYKKKDTNLVTPASLLTNSYNYHN